MTGEQFAIGADKLPTIVAVTALGPFSLRLAWSDGIEGELNMLAVLAEHRFAALRDPEEFARVTVGEWGHSLAWPSGAELGADTLRREMEAGAAAGIAVINGHDSD